MKKRKFADGGDTSSEEDKGVPPGGRFDSDTYARARAWQKRQMEGDGDPVPTPRAAAKTPAKAPARPVAAAAGKEAPTPSPAPRSAPAASSGRAEIPVGDEKAPPKDGSFQPGETGRNILNAMNAIAPGASKGAGAMMNGAANMGTRLRTAMQGGRKVGTELAERASNSVGPVRSAKSADPVYLKEIGMSPRAERLTMNPPATRVGMKPPAEKVEMAPRPLQLKMSPRKDAATDVAEKTTRSAASRVGKGAKDRMAKKNTKREETADVEYKKGGSVRGAGLAQRGCGKGSMR